MYKKIIICAIVPPIRKNTYEDVYGPITHDFPFVGNDEDRLRYTNKMNDLIQQKCIEYDFIYFDYYDFYKDKDGYLKYEFSDTNVHILNNSYILQSINHLIN